jgi:hypothetical protein
MFSCKPKEKWQFTRYLIYCIVDFESSYKRAEGQEAADAIW